MDRQSALAAMNDNGVYCIEQVAAFKGPPAGFPCLTAAFRVQPKNQATVNSLVEARFLAYFEPVFTFDFNQHRLLIAGDAAWSRFWPQASNHSSVSPQMDVFFIDHSVDSAAATINAFNEHMRRDYEVLRFRPTSNNQVTFQITRFRDIFTVRFSLDLYKTPEQLLESIDIATDGVAWYNGRLLLSATAKYAAETGIVLLNLRNTKPGFASRLASGIQLHNLGIGFPQLAALPAQRPVWFKYLRIDTYCDKKDQIERITAHQPISLLPERENSDILAVMKINAIGLLPTVKYSNLLRAVVQAAHIEHWWLRYVLMATPLRHCWSVVHEYIECSDGNRLLSPCYDAMATLLGHARAAHYINTHRRNSPLLSLALIEQLCTERLYECDQSNVAPLLSPVWISAADWFGTNASYF